MFLNLSQHASEVAGALPDAVGEYEGALYWATDRIGLYGNHDFLSEDGSLVHLLALRGKIRLLLEHLASTDSELDDALTSHLSSLIQSWGAYVEDFRAETTSKLTEHYTTFVLRFYGKPGDSWESLFQPDDLDWFQAQRDWIECFLLGSDIEWPEKDFRGPLVESDRRLKDFVETSVVPHILKKYTPSVIASENIDWLPESFWWRHL